MNVSGARACKADRNLLVDPIRASSLNRLHKQAGQTTAPDQRPVHHFMLATREPSTDDVQEQLGEISDGYDSLVTWEPRSSASSRKAEVAELDEDGRDLVNSLFGRISGTASVAHAAA